MIIPNTTYVTDLDKWDFGPLIREGRGVLQDMPNEILESEYFILTKIRGECLEAEEFDIGSKLGEGLNSVPLTPGGSIIVQLQGKLDVRRYGVRFGRKYRYPQGNFSLLIPKDKDLIYVVQELNPEKSFVQWANHKHDKAMQEILEKGEYALFQNVKSPRLPLAAIISGNDILMMGESLTAASGYYKEISRIKTP